MVTTGVSLGVDEGIEASIYLLHGAVWKVFHDNTKIENVQQNIDFLVKTSGRNRTPRILGFADASYGLIRMSRLPGVTLKKYVASLNYKTLLSKDKKVKEELLLKLYTARLDLPHDVIFKDFANASNIMVDLDASGYPINVMFIEGGTEEPNTANAINLFFHWAATYLSALQTDTYMKMRFKIKNLPNCAKRR